MQYMGSKARLASRIIPCFGETQNRIYVEPFVGGANMMSQVDAASRIGADSNPYLIAMWKALQEGWLPPSFVTKEDYRKVKANPENYPPELVCFYGFLISFGGKWFGGYSFNSKGDNYAARATRVLLKQIESLRDVRFECSSYPDLLIPDGALVYCDPPYAGTTNYKDKFSHTVFWQWVRDLSKRCEVFVSEYTAPEDFKCLLEIPHKTILDKNSNYPRLERLFRHSSCFRQDRGIQ